MKKEYINVFLRCDDIYEAGYKTKKVIGVFINNKVPLTLSVIPVKLSLSCARYLKKAVAPYPSLFDIAQHGLSHRNRAKTGNRYEFGPGVDYRTQKAEIKQGMKILKERLGISPEIFVPPWNGYDKETLKALYELGFKIISPDIKHAQTADLPSAGLLISPVSVYFNKMTSDGGFASEDINNLLSTILKPGRKYAGIEIHHRCFNSKSDYAKLDKLLKSLKSNPRIKISTLAKSARRKILCLPGINSEGLIYYLTYQFTPKPISIKTTGLNLANPAYNFTLATPPKELKKDLPYNTGMLYGKFKEILSKHLCGIGGPPAVLISGGIDSAAILHVLRELTGRKIHTFSAYYSGCGKNLPVCRKLSAIYGTVHHEVEIKPDSLKQLTKIYSWGIPEPIGDNGFLANYLIYKKAGNYCRDVFSGDGADCLFASLPSKHGVKGAKAYLHGESFLDNRLFDKFFKKHYPHIDIYKPLSEELKNIKAKNSFKKQIMLDLNFMVKNRVDYILYASQIFGLIMHLPFLDSGIIESCLKIPPCFLEKCGVDKYILRKAFEGRVIDEVRLGRRCGLTPPFRIWYASNREFVVKSLIKSLKLGLPYEYVKYLILNIGRGDDYRVGMRIWLILNLVCWQETGLKSL